MSRSSRSSRASRSRSSDSTRRSARAARAEAREPQAQSATAHLRSFHVGALPIINHFLERLDLHRLLAEHLPRESRRVQVDSPRALLTLVRNILLSREPIYGVGEWAARQAPDLLGLAPGEAAFLNDDRLGRSLDLTFRAPQPTFVMAVVRHMVPEFQLRLDELHNDSTTVSLFGAYESAQAPGRHRGQDTCAITYGYSKDHRPDLKQLLYILTLSEDGGVPVHVATASGNTADDQTHIPTWDLLRELVGGPDFLYVADCKLASRENLRHIAEHGGRFVTVLPATYQEDAQFRRQLREQPQTLRWRWLYDVTNEQGERVDRLEVCQQPQLTREGWRLFWYRSERKRELDAQARARRTQRAIAALADVQRRLAGPRPRLREHAQVRERVDAILQEFDVAAWLQPRIKLCVQEQYRQVGPGRPGPDTRFVQEQTIRFALTWEIDAQALAQEEQGDGVFPLIANVADWDAEQILRAYKRQPTIEKRFAQLKSDFAVAPVWLKEVHRIQALLLVYFLVLLVQSLLERELRQAMEREGLETLPLYPEGRPCRRPTARRVFDVFEPIQRHHLRLADGSEQVLVTELTPLQRQILKLLGLSPTHYGH